MAAPIAPLPCTPAPLRPGNARPRCRVCKYKFPPNEKNVSWFRVVAHLRLRSGDVCEARLRCGGRVGVLLQKHHMVKQEWGGSSALSNVLHVCGACHVHIHRNEPWALRNGWLIAVETNPSFG